MNDEIPESEQPLSRAEIIESAEESGLIVMREVTIAKLRDMGLAAQNAGLTDVAKGAVIMTLANCTELLEGVLDVARKAKTAKLRIDCAIAGAALAKGIQGCASTVNAAGLASPPVSTKKPRSLKIVSPPIDMQKTG